MTRVVFLLVALLAACSSLGSRVPSGQAALIDVGGRWDGAARLGLMLQVNALYKGRDSGTEAEPEDSGSRTVSLSPGVTYALTPMVQVYAFVQIPVYQQVNGVQLVAERSYAVDVSAQF